MAHNNTSVHLKVSDIYIVFSWCPDTVGNPQELEDPSNKMPFQLQGAVTEEGALVFSEPSVASLGSLSLGYMKNNAMVIIAITFACYLLGKGCCKNIWPQK